MALPSYVGRYAIRHEIARGAFAVVILAWDEELDSAVALKVLEPARLDGGAELQARFLDEARLLRRIRSHHVVTVHDVGRLNDGRPYFVMDLADRGTLADWLDGRRDKIHSEVPGAGTRELVAFADALTDGLGAIHRAGVVHRDIKPANILFQSVRPPPSDPDATIVHPASRGAPLPAHASHFDESRILVGDLGIAKDVLNGSGEATLLGGTPAYQAPEQTDPDHEVTGAADIYAATAVLYHLVTGMRPPRPGRLEEGLPRIAEHWHDVMQRGMAVAPEERYSSIESWQAAVHDVLAEEAAESTTLADATTLDLAGRPVSADCPYKGLGAYQPEDADRFFGREALTEELVRRLQAHNVLVVGGPSGSGKSSLVRAGLIPELKAGAVTNSAGWRISLMTPGRDALSELYFHLAQSMGGGSPAVGLDDVASHPALARRLAHPTGTEAPLVLVIDQFEELFTLSPPAQREPFIAALSAMTDPADAAVRVVIAVRADFYAACAQIPWLAERITENQVLVGPMTPAEMRRAITEPAREAGLYLERNLIDAIVDVAGNEAGSLPLVGHALVETWKRRKGATMTLEGYRAAGGVAGAIAQTADVTFEQRFNPAEQEAARRLFLRLVTPGEGAGDTRRIIERAEIEADATPEMTRRIVEQLTEARLLTITDKDVQITHEALLRSWPRLRGWIDEARDDLRMRQRLIRHAEEWQGSNRDTDLLLRGTPLLSAIDWQAKNPDQGGALVHDFVDTAATERDRVQAARQERQARARRMRTAAVVALSLLAIGTTIASGFAWFGYQDARRNALLAASATTEANARFSLALGAVGTGLAATDPRLALFLGGEAAARADAAAPGHEARAAIIAARQQLAGTGPHLLGSPIQVGDALALAMSPDGAFVAVGGRDGTITLIDALNRQPVGTPLIGHEGGVEELAFSPDSKQLASAGDDGTVRLWPVNDGFAGEDTVLLRLEDVVWGVTFDPSGKWLATASEDQSVRLLDVGGGEQTGEPVATHLGDALSVSFSPDGKGLLAGTGNGDIHGWTLPSGEIASTISGVHTSDVWDLVFAPGGNRFATVSADGTSALFSYPEGEFLGKAFDPGTQVKSALFTKDGQSLIGGGADGRLHLWNHGSQKARPPSAEGHTGRIVRLAMSGDGQHVATLGRDQTVQLWTMYQPVPVSKDRRVSAGAAKGVALSADASLVAAADERGDIHLWRGDGSNPLTLPGHTQQVWALALSPDGALLASGDRAGNLRLWDVASGQQRGQNALGGGAIWWLGFTPDGTKLIAAKDDGIDFLDPATGERTGWLRQEVGQITRAAISPDGLIVAASTTDGRVRLIDPDAPDEVRDFQVMQDVLWSVTFSPDGRSLAVAGSDEVVSIVDRDTGFRRATLGGHSGGATDLIYLTGGSTLAVTDRQGGLHLWDMVDNRRLAAPIAAHSRTSWRIAATGSTDTFVTAGDDGEVRTWDILNIAEACRIGTLAFDRDHEREYFGEGEHDLACRGL